MVQKDINNLANLAIEISRKAGEIIIERENHVGNIHSKSNKNDLVTDIDFIVENFIIEYLRKITPEADFVSEETGLKNSSSAVTWIIDPIDGTGYYSKGISLYTTTLALVLDGEPQIGIINHPKEKNIFHATKNGGMFYNGKKTKIPSHKKKIRESICYLDTDKINEASVDQKLLIKNITGELLSKVYRVRMFGVSSIAYSWLSLDIIDTFIDITGKNPKWDSVAGNLIVQEAGAISEYITTNNNSIYIATNPQLWEEYMNIIKSGDKNA